MESDLKFHATERMAYGFADPRGLPWAGAWKWDPRVERLLSLTRTIFRTDAEVRGYCMALWDSHVPKGFGCPSYGVVR